MHGPPDTATVAPREDLRTTNGRGESAFADMPGDAATHFLLHFYAAVYAIINYLRQAEAGRESPIECVLEAHPFLAGYFTEMVARLPDDLTWSEGSAWWEAQITRWECAASLPFPLCTLEEITGLGFPGRMSFVLAGLVEEDARFSTLFQELQALPGKRRPTIELLTRLLAGTTEGDPWNMCYTLLRGGWLEATARDAPRAEWSMKVPLMLWNAARGETAFDPSGPFAWHPAASFDPLADLFVPEEFLHRLARVPALLSNRRVDALVLRGTPGSERLPVAGAVAAAIGRHVLSVSHGDTQCEYLGPLCMMLRALPVITCDPAPGETVRIPRLRGYDGPVGILMGRAGGLAGEAVQQAATFELPPLNPQDRYRCWRAALGDAAGDDLETVVERFALPGGHIRRVAKTARTHAELEGRPRVTLPDVRTACRQLNHQMLDTLADRLEARGTWNDLVVAPPAAAGLRELHRRCRHRERLVDHLREDADVNRGVRALFAGPSGTGKTLAARILANELGMDLYRVDLAAVVNKYIGETEKNLHRVLETAEELDVVLLLDEGDALLSRRTTVKSSNDRYANLETNYLLQRLEHYQGLVVVTTNLLDNVDRAFQRRMDAAVTFLPPRTDERLRIWELHLPDTHAVDSTFLQHVAERCTFTGGQIRNVTLRAALLALETEDERVRRGSLEAAIRREYRKAGAVCPLDAPSPSAPPDADMQAFLDALNG